jgi:hypothetical protein
MDMIVLHFTDVPSNTLENSKEKSVLEEVITVTADIEVSKRLQLYNIPEVSELSSVNGAILKYLRHMSQLYPLCIALTTYRTGNAYDTRLIKSGYGNIGKIHD